MSDPSGLFVIYIGVGGGWSFSNSPATTNGGSTSYLTGVGFDTSSGFFTFNTTGHGNSGYGLFGGGGVSGGIFTGNESQFMGCGTSSSVGAGTGLEGTGASYSQSNS